MPRPELLEFIAKEEYAPAILSSEDIARLAFQPNGKGLTKMGFRHDLFGETLLRHSLYNGDLPEPLAELYARPEFEEVRSRFERLEVEDHPGGTEGDDNPRAFQYFKKRQGDFDRAHGIIPVWHENVDEAIPVPFTCEEGMLAGIWDKGRGPDQPQLWQDCLNELDLPPHIRSIRLQVPLGPFLTRVCGRSLMLPIYLAASPTNFVSKLCKYIATGEIRDSRIHSVAGLDAKMQLAERMGVELIGVGSSNSGNVPCPVDGESLDVFSERLKQRTLEQEKNELEHMPPWKVREIVKKWQSQMDRRTVGSPEAIEIFQCILNRLETADDEDVRKDTWMAHLCLGGAYNHLGNSKSAEFHLNEVCRNMESFPSTAIVSACATRTVCLTDDGELEEAEAWARKALDHSETLDGVDSADRKRCRLQAFGALGAQPLMQIGLWDEQKRKESLKYLQDALKNADSLIELISPDSDESDKAKSEWAHTHGQFAWWHAHFDPKEFFKQFETWRNELEEQSPQVFKSQFPYLCRGRWLAAFRSTLSDENLPDGWEQWDLPEPSRDHENWLLALSLKYRGFLWDKQNQPEKAKADFDRAVELLNIPGGGLIMNYMKATVLALAACCLEEGGEQSGSSYREKAIEEFTSLEEVGSFAKHPKASPTHWLRFLKKETGKLSISESPQVYFPY